MPVLSIVKKHKFVPLLTSMYCEECNVDWKPGVNDEEVCFGKKEDYPLLEYKAKDLTWPDTLDSKTGEITSRGLTATGNIYLQPNHPIKIDKGNLPLPSQELSKDDYIILGDSPDQMED